MTKNGTLYNRTYNIVTFVWKQYPEVSSENSSKLLNVYFIKLRPHNNGLLIETELKHS